MRGDLLPNIHPAMLGSELGTVGGRVDRKGAGRRGVDPRHHEETMTTEACEIGRPLASSPMSLLLC